MDIKKIELKYLHKNGFIKKNVDNRCHSKILPWISIVQATEGSYDIALKKRSFKNTGSGGFFIAPSGVQQHIIHNVDPQSKQINCRWIFFDAVINDVYRFDSLYDFPLIIPEPERSELNSLFDLLFSSDNIFENYCCYYKILDVLFRISSPKSNTIPQTMQITLDYIDKNISSKISIEDLAKNANMSASNFYAVFKKQFGLSPIAYINNYRLSLATKYLERKDYTITEIGNMVGIQDPLYFSKMFSKAYGLSPRQYREEY